MKKQIISAIILLALFLSSCNKDSSSSKTNAIEGQWKLVNVSGTFAGIHDNFTPGLITWSFNPITQMVSVTNNNTDTSKWDVLETGVYPYHFVNNPDAPCTESIDINGSVYGCYTIANDSLVIDQSIADGFAITLKQ